MVPRPRCVDVTRCGASTFFGKVSKTGHGHRKHDGHRKERAGNPREHAGLILEPVLDTRSQRANHRRWSPGSRKTAIAHGTTGDRVWVNAGIRLPGRHTAE